MGVGAAELQGATGIPAGGSVELCFLILIFKLCYMLLVVLSFSPVPRVSSQASTLGQQAFSLETVHTREMSFCVCMQG